MSKEAKDKRKAFRLANRPPRRVVNRTRLADGGAMEELECGHLLRFRSAGPEVTMRGCDQCLNAQLRAEARSLSGAPTRGPRR